MRKVFCLLVFSVFIFSFLGRDTVHAVSRDEFYALGVSQIVDGNKAVARLKALSDFKQQVIMQAILQMLGPSVLENNKETIQKEFLKRADNYIKSFRIFSEDISGELYRINGEATVLTQKLQEDLITLGLMSQQGNANIEMKANTNLIMWISDPSCSLNIGNDNAANFFDESLIGKLTENGWTVIKNGEKQGDEETNPVYVVKNRFFCQRNLIQCRIEVRDNSDNSVKGVISESVMRDAETPVLESVLTLIEIVTPQFLNIIGQGRNISLVESDKPETFGTSWTIEIMNSPDFVKWEEIESKLKEQNVNFKIKRIIQDAGTLNVTLEDVPNAIGDYLDGLVLDTGSKVVIENLDPHNKKILISIKSIGSSESR